jgi:hypothetical protein
MEYLLKNTINNILVIHCKVKQTNTKSWNKSCSQILLMMIKHKFVPMEKVVAQRGARTHDPEIKSLMLYRLS